VHVDVHEFGTTNAGPGIERSEEPHVEAGFDAFPPGRLRRLAGIDVPSRLQPESEPLVLQQ
jgi:hypothetical protein